MSELINNTEAAERAIGCTFAANFESPEKVVANGGVINGDPVINFGAVLDGVDDYFDFALAGTEFNSANISIVIEFTPNFDTDVGVTTVLCDGTSTVRYLVQVGSTGLLNLQLGNTSIPNIAEAVYSPFWNVGERNVFVISGTSGDTSAWLNGNEILANDNTAWTPTPIANFFIGAAFNGTAVFDGTMHSVKVFDALLTQQEAQDYTDNTTYNYRNNTVVDLQLRSEDHDATNVQTLDVSGNGNDAAIGDGSTGTTFPTKLQKRGYSFDGGDYLLGAGAANLPLGSSARTVAVTVDTKDFGAADQGILGWGIDDALGEFSTMVNSSSQMFVHRFGGSVTLSSSVVPTGGIHTLVYVFEDDVLTGFVDGINQGSVALASLDTGDDGSFTVGARNSFLNNKMTGDMFQATIFDFGLTPLQVADYHINALKSINQT